MKVTLGERLDAWNTWSAAHPVRVCAAAALLLAVQVSTVWYVTPDSAAYLSMARSLLTPDGPTTFGSPHLFFSLGYPTLVAPTFLLSEKPFLWIGIVHWLLSVGLMTGIYRWLRPLCSRAALFATVFSTLHVLFALHFRRPLSETAFMTELLWAGLLLDRVRTNEAIGARLGFGAAGTLLLVVAALTRPNGILMAPAFAVALLAEAWGNRRRLRAAMITGGIVGAIVGGTFLWSRAIDDARATASRGATYWDYLATLQNTEKSLLGRLPDGVLFQMCDFERLIVPGAFKSRANAATTLGKWLDFNTVLALGCTVIVVVGWRRLIGLRGDVYTWTLPFYAALNVVWAADAGTRYTVPVLPLVAAALWFGAIRLRPRIERWAVPFVVLHAIVMLGFWLGVDLPRNRAWNRTWPAVETLSAKVNRNHETIAAWSLLPEQVALFQYQLDRPLESLDAATAATGPIATMQPTWIVGRDSAVAAPPGYVEAATAAPYRMWRRTQVP